MKLLITGTVLNLCVNLLLLCVVWRLYRRSRNLGRQQVLFKAGQIRARGRFRRMTRPYLYRIDISYNGSTQSVLATKEEYEELLRNRTGSAMVYVREFPARFLNPDFEKYEFSFQETDWRRRDKSRCLKGFLAVFVPLELIIFMIASA